MNQIYCRAIYKSNHNWVWKSFLVLIAISLIVMGLGLYDLAKGTDTISSTLSHLVLFVFEYSEIFTAVGITLVVTLLFLLVSAPILMTFGRATYLEITADGIKVSRKANGVGKYIQKSNIENVEIGKMDPSINQIASTDLIGPYYFLIRSQGEENQQFLIKRESMIRLREYLEQYSYTKSDAPIPVTDEDVEGKSYVPHLSKRQLIYIVVGTIVLFILYKLIEY